MPKVAPYAIAESTFSTEQFSRHWLLPTYMFYFLIYNFPRKVSKGLFALCFQRIVTSISATLRNFAIHRTNKLYIHRTQSIIPTKIRKYIFLAFQFPQFLYLV